jgi:hypothetical protein
VAVLPDQDGYAVGGADGDEVEQHGFGGEQEGSEGAREEQEGEGCDEGEHEREVSVDGVGEVVVLGSDAADSHAGVCRGGGPDFGDGVFAGGGAGLVVGLDIDQCGAVAAPGGVGGGDGGVDAG